MGLVEIIQKADGSIFNNASQVYNHDFYFTSMYYIDYRNVRADYLEKYWSLVNWDFVSYNLLNSIEGKYIEFPYDEYSGACEFKETR